MSRLMLLVYLASLGIFVVEETAVAGVAVALAAAAPRVQLPC